MQGGGWTAAPKPEMSDALYVPEDQWQVSDRPRRSPNCAYDAHALNYSQGMSPAIERKTRIAYRIEMPAGWSKQVLKGN